MTACLPGPVQFLLQVEYELQWMYLFYVVAVGELRYQSLAFQKYLKSSYYVLEAVIRNKNHKSHRCFH
jgi:hypothetical protein